MKKLIVAAACVSLMCGPVFARTGMNQTTTNGMSSHSPMDSNAKMMKKKMKKGSMSKGDMGGMDKGGMDKGGMDKGMSK
jgi:uncharacterized protein involved in copper resistance